MTLHFDTIPACDGRTDEQRDRQTRRCRKDPLYTHSVARVKISQYLTKLCIEYLEFTLLAYPVNINIILIVVRSVNKKPSKAERPAL